MYDRPSSDDLPPIDFSRGSLPGSDLELGIVPTEAVQQPAATAEIVPIVASEKRRSPAEVQDVGAAALTPALGHPEEEGSIEPAAGHAMPSAEESAGTGVARESEEPPLASTEVGNNPPTPPAGPGETANADTPDPGASLQRIIAAAVASAELPIDDTMDIVQGMEADEAELSEARRVHGEALRAAGMEFYMGDRGLEPRIADPAAFTAAMQAMPVPESPVIAAHLHEQLNDIVGEALYSVSTEVIRAGGTVPLDPIASELPQQATALAQEMSRTDADTHTIEAMRQLSTAHEEGSIGPWAVRYDIGVIGRSSERIGIDRLAHQPEWDAVYRFFEQLQQDAPNARLTREVRDTVLRDITTALLEDDHTPNPVPNNPEITVHWQEVRDELNRNSQSLLREALQRIPRILPE